MRYSLKTLIPPTHLSQVLVSSMFFFAENFLYFGKIAKSGKKMKFLSKLCQFSTLFLKNTLYTSQFLSFFTIYEAFFLSLSVFYIWNRSPIKSKTPDSSPKPGINKNRRNWRNWQIDMNQQKSSKINKSLPNQQ